MQTRSTLSAEECLGGSLEIFVYAEMSEADFIRASQRDAMRSKACCKAVLHLIESLSAEEFNEKVRLMKIWVDEDYPEATEEQKANLTKLFREV
jgi:hypothetical protein